MFKKDRKDFEQKWDNFKVFIEYGMLTEEKFFEKAKDFFLYKTTDNNYFTFTEFIEKVGKIQKNKEGKTIILYTNSTEDQHSFVKSATDKGYQVLELEGPLVSHLISKIEADSSDVQFSRVDSDTIDKLIEKDDAIASKLSEKEEEDLKKIIENSVEGEKFSVDIQSMDSKELPIIITQSEFMRRMKEQQALSGGMQMFGSMPEKYNLVINSNHQLIAKVLAEKTKDKRELLIQQLIDLALLSQDMLKGKELTQFVSRTLGMVK